VSCLPSSHYAQGPRLASCSKALMEGLPIHAHRRSAQATSPLARPGTGEGTCAAESVSLRLGFNMVIVVFAQERKRVRVSCGMCVLDGQACLSPYQWRTLEKSTGSSLSLASDRDVLLQTLCGPLILATVLDQDRLRRGCGQGT